MTSQTILRITPPTGLQANIDVMNDFIYPNIMGITRQALLLLRKFMKKRRKLSLLRWINMKISLVRMIGWLVGKRFTEVDIGLFTTLVHFDSVYYRHFKCNLRCLVDYLNHWNHTKRIYNISSIAATVNFKHIKNITTAATRPSILQVSFLSDQICIDIFKKRH